MVIDDYNKPLAPCSIIRHNTKTASHAFIARAKQRRALPGNVIDSQFNPTKQMKWRFILTVAAGILLLVHALNFSMNPSTGAFGFGMLVMLIFMVTLVLNFTGVFTLWKMYKALALLPLLVLLGSCAASRAVGKIGFDHRIKAFTRNQTRYDEIISKVVLREIPDPTVHEIQSDKTKDDYIAFRTPQEYQDLIPYLITADRDGTNTVAVRLVLCVMFPNHHRAYLWRPDGHFEKSLREYEYVQTVINTNWCAIGD